MRRRRTELARSAAAADAELAATLRVNAEHRALARADRAQAAIDRQEAARTRATAAAQRQVARTAMREVLLDLRRADAPVGPRPSGDPVSKV